MTYLKPSDLTAEERAIWDALAIREFPSFGATHAYAQTKGAMECVVLARRALFSPAAESARCQHSHEFHGDVWECQRESGHSGSHECKSWSELGKKGAEHPEPKVECPNCRGQVATQEEHVSSRNRDSFTCQPAASGEMPEVKGGDFSPLAVVRYLRWLAKWEGYKNLQSQHLEWATGLEVWDRTHMQPDPAATVDPVAGREMRVHAAAAGKRGELVKVREGIELLLHKVSVEPSITVGHYDLMLMEMKAELDAAEGR